MRLLTVTLVLYLSLSTDAFYTLTAGKAEVKDYIVDLDAGVDDYQALAFLLNADKRGEIKIAAIVLSDGNTALNDVKINVCRLLEILRRTDIPVYAGSFETILDQKEPDHWFGLDGFGDLGLAKTPRINYIRKEIAPTAIANMVKRYPLRYNYIAFGPLTNLALSMRMYDHVARDIGEIYIMGGNYGAHFQEFNFLADPESAYMVLNTIGKPATMFTFQACINEDMTMEWRRSIEKDMVPNPVWNLNDMAEQKLFKKLTDSFKYNSCDPILAAIILRPDEMIDGFSYNKAKVVLCSNETENVGRGEVVVEGSTPAEANVKIIHKFFPDYYQKFYIEQFNTICTNFKCDMSYSVV